MKKIFLFVAFLLLLLAPSGLLAANTPLTNAQLSGTDNQVKSGAKLTIMSGATLEAAAGSTIVGFTGAGDITGPASSTDNALVRFDGTTGKVIQNSSATLNDAGQLSVSSLSVTTPIPVASGGTGTATPALVAGTNVSITGTWPNQTINSSASGTGTVNSGTSGQLGYYATTGTAISGFSGSALTSSGLSLSTADTTATFLALINSSSGGGTWYMRSRGSGGSAGTFDIGQTSSPASDGYLKLSAAGALKLGAYTTAGVLINDTSGNVTDVAPGTSGNILTSNGTTWTSAAAPTGTLPTQTGHSGEFLTTNGTAASWAAVSGTGTVTSVSVTTANGVSGSVANATSTPAITLTLGAITPTTVVASTSGQFPVLGLGAAASAAQPLLNASSVTAATGLGVGFYNKPSLTASANGDVLSLMATGTNLYGGASTVATGSFTGVNLSGLVVSQPTTETGSPGIATHYGIYIDTPTLGSVSNYSIYSVGGQNYFGGAMRFANLSTAGVLVNDASGNVTSSNSPTITGALTITPTALTSSTGIAISGTHSSYTLALAHNTTFSTTGLTAGGAINIVITTDGTARTMLWPAGWNWVGSTVGPGSQAASTTALLSLYSSTTADGGIVAAYGVTGSASPWGSFSGTPVALTFQNGVHKYLEGTLGANTTFTASGYAQGAEVSLLITGDTATRTLTFPSAWKWVTPPGATSGAPTSIAGSTPGALMRVDLLASSTTESSVVASYALQAVSAATAFSSPVRTNIVLELAADDTSTDGAAISSWSDTSGNGYNATQATSGNQPIWKTNQINGHAVSRYDGVNDGLVSSFTTLAQPVTGFAVIKTASSSSQSYLGCPPGGADAFIDTGNIGVYAGSANASETGGSTGIVVVSFVIDGANTKVWRNGAQVVTGTNPGTSGYTSGAVIGGYDALLLSGTMNGDIAYIALYSGTMSSTPRKSVEAALGVYYAQSITP